MIELTLKMYAGIWTIFCELFKWGPSISVPFCSRCATDAYTNEISKHPPENWELLRRCQLTACSLPPPTETHILYHSHPACASRLQQFYIVGPLKGEEQLLGLQRQLYSQRKPSG